MIIIADLPIHFRLAGRLTKRLPRAFQDFPFFDKFYKVLLEKHFKPAVLV